MDLNKAMRQLEDALKLLEESDKYGVYSLVNHTRKEVYFGIAKDFQRRFDEHQAKGVDATQQWKFESDDIRHVVLRTDLPQKEASDFAHDLERMPASQIPRQLRDYKFIQTSGK